MPTVLPAVEKTYRVVWYESTHSAAPGRAKVTRRETFEVKARGKDAARSLAKAHVRKRGGRVLAASFAARASEIVVYTPRKET